MKNFALIILELTDSEKLIFREQWWLDSIKPEYNILKKAESSQGYKHSSKDIEIIK